MEAHLNADRSDGVGRGDAAAGPRRASPDGGASASRRRWERSVFAAPTIIAPAAAGASARTTGNSGWRGFAVAGGGAPGGRRGLLDQLREAGELLRELAAVRVSAKQRLHEISKLLPEDVDAARQWAEQRCRELDPGDIESILAAL